MSDATYYDQRVVFSQSVERLLFLFVWMTFFLNGIVMKEPAPCDILMMGFVVVMPLFGLVRITPLHVLLLTGWMVIIATGLIAAGGHEFYYISLRHILITAYLAVFSVVLAGFITHNPLRHHQIIWNGYLCGAIVAAIAGIIGYFDLIPGSYELFTRYERARGTFKDPNVFGPFLVPAFLYCLNYFLTHKTRSGFLTVTLMCLFLFGILMCFSRGAWMLLFIATSLFVLVFFVTARSGRERLRTVALCLVGLVVLAGVVLTSLQSDKVKDLFTERSSIVLDYDVGDQGRFIGHKKAADIILDNPLGIGALYFGYYYHHELPHNVYLSMFLSSGWIGGTVFLVLMTSTLLLGGLILFRRSSWMQYHAIAYCTFVGLVVESYIIDTDHWRLLFILMGMIWGNFAAARIEDRHEARAPLNGSGVQLSFKI